MKYFMAFLIVAWAAMTPFVRPASAQVAPPSTAPSTPTFFNMNFIVTDEEFTDANTLTPDKIQQFLATQPGMLAAYVDPATQKSAAQIIYDASQASQINPRVILTTLQKESSLLTRTDFGSRGPQYYLDWAVFYSWCDSCTTGNAAYKGFANQISAAAGAYRRYLNNIAVGGSTGYSNWGPGRSNPIPCIASDYNNGRQLCTPGSDVNITPVNSATAALYTYTPHPGGNYAFWTIWNNYNFSLRRFYPDGSLLRAQGGRDVYVVKNGLLRRFTNSAAFLSRFSFNMVITVPADHLLAYDQGDPISFANYALLASPVGGVYLLVDDGLHTVKRPIKSRGAFQQAGFQRSEVVKVSWADLNPIPDGAEITVDNIYPSGRLVQNNKNGMVFYVKDGVRNPVASKDILRSQFGLRRPVPISPVDLEKFAWGDFVKFKDGSLVTSKTPGGAIYVISDGQRLPISGMTTFNAYHFNMKNVMKTDDASLAVHPVGATLNTDVTVQSASLP